MVLTSTAAAQVCPTQSDEHRYAETVLDKKNGDGQINIHYVVPFGFDESKPTLLIINGGPGGDHQIVRGFESLKDDFNLVSFDHRGLGCTKITSPYDSSYRAQLYSISKSSDDIDAIRKDLLGTKGKWFVYGLSYGGMLAQKYAFKYQSHIIGLILDSTFHAASAIDLGRKQYKSLFIDNDPKTKSMYDEIISRYPEAKHSLLRTIWGATYSFKGRTVDIPKLFEDILAEPDPKIAKDLYFDAMEAGPFWGMSIGIACEEIWDFAKPSEEDKYYFAMFAQTCPSYGESLRKTMEWTEDLKKLSVKTLMLSGAFDPVTPASNMKTMKNLAQNAYIFTNTHSGHGIFFEKPDCTKSLMTDFASSQTFDNVEKIANSNLCQKEPDTTTESVYIEWKDRIGVSHNSL